ncbi:3264_t:CDS:1, partial [Gigaspora margarita]
TGHGNIREGNYKKQQKQPTLYQKRSRSSTKPELMKYDLGGAYNKQGNTKTP